MKRILLPSLLLALPALAFAQGALTPPAGAFSGGAPTATMKTLDQVEPRTPLRTGSHGVTQNVNGGFTISASGSYYLEGNLSVGTGDGIIIEVGNVSIDLSGFTISSFASPANGSGIYVDGDHSNIAIRNGHIRGTTTYVYATSTFIGGGFNNGVLAYGGVECRGRSVTGLSVVGMGWGGITLCGNGSTISDCTVSTCAGLGFNADTVRDSTGMTCEGQVIEAKTVNNCYASGVNTAHFYTIRAETVTNCQASADGGDGIRAFTVINSIGSSDSGIGIFAEQTATGCYGTTSSGAAGLQTGTAENCRGFVIGRNGKGTGIGLWTGIATGCYGTSTSGIGLKAYQNATNCTGDSGSSTGLFAVVATGCGGNSTSGIGLQAAQNATGCTGTTASGSNGILVGDTGAAGTAENCRGIVTDGTGTGLSAETASNCFGQSTAGTGLSATTATNCSAYTATGSIAMSVAGSASNCRGNNGGSGKAIEAAIAVSCTSAHGTISAPNKYNMP